MIIPDARRATWSGNVGVPGGITHRTTTPIDVTASPYYAAGNIETTTRDLVEDSDTLEDTLEVADASYFDVHHNITIDVIQVQTVTITHAATGNGTLHVNANGSADALVAVTTGESINDIATAIRAETFIGSVTGGSGAVITFTATTVGRKPDNYCVDFDLTSGVTATAENTVLGAFSTVITAKSGTTLTIADNSPSTVTASTVLHDDTAAIQAAYDAVTADDVLYIPGSDNVAGSAPSKGTYNVRGLSSTNGYEYTVRGDAPGETILRLTAQSGVMFSVGASPSNDAGPTQSVTAGMTKGSTEFTVADTSGFYVGRTIEFTPVIPVWSHNLGGQPRTNRNLVVSFMLESKTSTTLTFSPPCPFDYTGMDPKVTGFNPANAGIPATTGVGFEDLTIDMNSKGFTAIYWKNCYAGWIKNVEIHDMHSRTVYFDNCSRMEIRRCWVHDHDPGGARR